MALAFSNHRIVRRIVNAENTTTLLVGINAILVEAGWVRSAIEGGHLYDVTSTQGLRCKVKLTDPGVYEGLTPYVLMQWLSSSGSPEGVAHRLGTGLNRTYIVHAGLCQVFIAIPGVTGHGTTENPKLYSSVSGGILCVPDDRLGCPYLGEAFDAWWSSGSGNSSVAACNLRKDLADYTNPRYPVFSACYNGSALLSPTSGSCDSISILRLVSLHPAGWTVWNTPPRTVFHSERPLYLEPFLAWGTGGVFKSIPAVRGLIWDAMLVTKFFGADVLSDFGSDIPEFNGMTWVSYNGDDPDASGEAQNIFGTLFLLVTTPTGFYNVAY